MRLNDSVADFSLRSDSAQRLGAKEPGRIIPSLAADRLYQLAALVAGVILLATLL